MWSVWSRRFSPSTSQHTGLQRAKYSAERMKIGLCRLREEQAPMGKANGEKTYFHSWGTSYVRVVVSSHTPRHNSRNPGPVQACMCGPRKAMWPAARVTPPPAAALELMLPCHAGPLPPRGRDQALLCPPPSVLKPGEAAAASLLHLHAAGRAVREGRSYQPGCFCSSLSSFLEAAHHMAELCCDGYKAVFKTQYPSFPHGR